MEAVGYLKKSANITRKEREGDKTYEVNYVQVTIDIPVDSIDADDTFFLALKQNHAVSVSISDTWGVRVPQKASAQMTINIPGENEISDVPPDPEPDEPIRACQFDAETICTDPDQKCTDCPSNPPPPKAVSLVDDTGNLICCQALVGREIKHTLAPTIYTVKAVKPRQGLTTIVPKSGGGDLPVSAKQLVAYELVEG